MQNTQQLALGNGIYTIAEMAHMLRLPHQKVASWIRHYWDQQFGQHLQKAYSWKVGGTTAVDFYTLIEFYVMVKLEQQGVKAGQVVRAHQELSQLFHSAHPFAQKGVLAGLRTDMRKLYHEHKGQIISLDGSRQINLDFIKVFFQKLAFGDDKMVSQLWPLGKTRKIVCDPNYKFGHPIIEGHNIYPETIYSHILAGDPIPYVAHIYQISEHLVQDAIAYCQPEAA